MMDRSVPWISLAMRLDSLEHLPEFRLPEGYGWRFYHDGDKTIWTEIEASAGEFTRPENGIAAFERYYPEEEQLHGRMLFLTDGGNPFATATAWFGNAGPNDSDGCLHWVSVDAAHQGRGLSRPLVSLALRRMRALGHSSAFLTTQTASWVAIKVYYQFGFLPMIREAGEVEGWRIVTEKTGIDFLDYIN